jgi:photosystem II stability/assembly factor-like uncharacterized protein
VRIRGPISALKIRLATNWRFALVALAVAVNGESQWEPLRPVSTSGTTLGVSPTNLEAICFVDNLTGWIVGGNQILRTNDGGKSWSINTVNTRFDLSAVCFLDRSQGWVAGSLRRRPAVGRTEDGGLTWKLLTIDGFGPGSLHDIEFIDSQRGWASGEVGDSSRGAIFGTTDGGSIGTLSIGQGETANLVQYVHTLTT